MASHRRVVTGIDDEGKSAVLFDGPGGVEGEGEITTLLLWQSDEAPASNEGTEDAAREASSFAFPPGGNKFVLARYPPGKGLLAPGMHASDTLDYGVVLSGSLTLILEAGETDLHAGDFLIDRGVLHGWRNDGSQEAVMLWTILDARPTARPATV